MGDLITFHLELHKGCRPPDIYKLLHQSVFGPEHLGRYLSESTIREEMKTPFFERESLVEPISVDGGACRINLRPAAQQGIAANVLATAVRQSTTTFDRDMKRFSRVWLEAERLLKRWPRKRFSEEEIERFSRMVEARKFPPLHHSDSYRKYNRPAYRVLARDELDFLIPRPRDSGQ